MTPSPVFLVLWLPTYAATEVAWWAVVFQKQVGLEQGRNSTTWASSQWLCSKREMAIHFTCIWVSVLFVPKHLHRLFFSVFYLFLSTVGARPGPSTPQPLAARARGLGEEEEKEETTGVLMRMLPVSSRGPKAREGISATQNVNIGQRLSYARRKSRLAKVMLCCVVISLCSAFLLGHNLSSSIFAVFNSSRFFLGQSNGPIAASGAGGDAKKVMKLLKKPQSCQGYCEISVARSLLMSSSLLFLFLWFYIKILILIFFKRTPAETNRPWHEAPVPRNQDGRRTHGREVGGGREKKKRWRREKKEKRKIE